MPLWAIHYMAVYYPNFNKNIPPRLSDGHSLLEEFVRSVSR